MSEYYDCIRFVKTKSDKTIPRLLGSAKKRDDGGFNVYLDALPPDGQFAIVPQRPREGQAKPPAQGRDMDDEIPF